MATEKVVDSSLTRFNVLLFTLTRTVCMHFDTVEKWIESFNTIDDAVEGFIIDQGLSLVDEPLNAVDEVV